MSEAVRGTKAERPKLSVRTGASRKLLEQKALARAADGLAATEPLEANFPYAADGAGGVVSMEAPVDEPAEVTQGKQRGATPLPASPPPPPPAAALNALPGPLMPTCAPVPAATPQWSDEDESAFQTLAVRRKATGYQRRGRDVGEQSLFVGTIKPNANTVVAVIVGIVADRGRVERKALLDAMATASFPHRKARPDDRGWCQGYVAGALRDGFLALAEQPALAAQVE